MLKNYLFSPLCSAPLLSSSPLSLSVPVLLSSFSSASLFQFQLQHCTAIFFSLGSAFPFFLSQFHVALFFFVFFLVQPSIFQPKTVLSPKPKTFCFFSSALLFSFNACLFVQPTQLFQPLFVLFQPFFFLLVLFSAHLFFCFSLFSPFLQRLPFCSVQRHSFHLLFFLLFFSFQFTCCPFFSPKQFSLQPKTFFSSAQNIFFKSPNMLLLLVQPLFSFVRASFSVSCQLPRPKIFSLDASHFFYLNKSLFSSNLE